MCTIQQKQETSKNNVCGGSQIKNKNFKDLIILQIHPHPPKPSRNRTQRYQQFCSQPNIISAVGQFPAEFTD